MCYGFAGNKRLRRQKNRAKKKERGESVSRNLEPGAGEWVKKARREVGVKQLKQSGLPNGY